MEENPYRGHGGKLLICNRRYLAEEVPCEPLCSLWGRFSPRPLRLAAGAHLPPRLFARLSRIASGDLLVPGGVEGPSPSFAYGAANHGPECARLADRALVDVDENSAKHHDRGDIVYDIADGDGGCSERSRARPQDGSGDDVENAADNDLPEQEFLPGVEKAGFWGIDLFFAGGNLLDVAHPAGIGRGPQHGLEPVQHLECKEENEGYTKIWVQGAGELSAAEDRSDPMKQPGEIEGEAGEQGEEEKERDCPMQDARVHRMAQQLPAIDGGVADGFETLASLVVETFDRAR